MTTICLPAFSGRRATCRAAQSAAPEEMPTRSPSSRAARCAVSKASWLVDADHLVVDVGVEDVGDESRADALERVGSLGVRPRGRATPRARPR